MCEYTPREIIMAAGGIPICLCGGSADTIPAAEEVLPANLCPLIKSTYGYSRTGKNPFLTDIQLVVAETTCDGKKKMYELLAEIHPVYVLELPQKSDDPDAHVHWKRELEKLIAHLENTFNTRITHEKLRAAIAQMNRERSLRRRLAQFSTQKNPPLTGRQLLECKSIISAIPKDLAALEQGITHLEFLSLPRQNTTRAVRVLLTGVPTPHGAERIISIIEESGGSVVAQENCTGLKPIREDVDENNPDPVDALARKYFAMPCSVLTTNTRREELITELAQEFHAEAVIDLTWMACLTYDIESTRIEKLCEQNLNIPYLRISTDYSPHDSARIGLRIQALFETISSAVSL
jgi:benzoyl-CoA reductase/2-hydroxyglutaryl-CoA dehydratase subunit BcrC/BadD/HgdB